MSQADWGKLFRIMECCHQYNELSAAKSFVTERHVIYNSGKIAEAHALERLYPIADFAWHHQMKLGAS